jgi:hypothetical protein
MEVAGNRDGMSMLSVSVGSSWSIGPTSVNDSVRRTKKE